MPRVFVTGIGIISAIGSDAESVGISLHEQKSGIGKIQLIDTIYKDEIPAGEIKASNDELRDMAGIRKHYRSRTAILGIIAAGQAIYQAQLNEKSLEKCALISGTTIGGMDRTENFYKEFLKNKKGGKIAEVAGHDCGAGTEIIADYFGIGGFLSTINTACSSSANAIMLAARLIKQGKIKTALAGGVDCLTKFTLNGFNSLMILDREQCRPFDENRNGLNLGEGSAFLVLESEESVYNDNKKILAEIKGYGNACDAFHQTASSPDGNGALLAMKLALETAGLDSNEIDYINTHGTGTKNNDLSEGIAIERLFGNNVPPCSSTKSYTGHTLGAAGAIEAVISILAIRNQCIFPNLNFSQKMQELKFTPASEMISQVTLRNVMSNSFGFGGNNSSLIISGN
ncbi:MAG TPA: beta-ketoacyl-[acyl-carrier-protein] synthase family protein [Bacteroidales bacterium]|nr:beta-ketoacyl-[acyl-carrier-protein] synthase family protein [Bacteroidales bacterium]